MARSCAINPKVFNKEGQVVESKLFSDINEFTSRNRELTKQIYATIKSDDFVKNFTGRLQEDVNGEPTLSSLLKETNLSRYITDEAVLKRLNTIIGHFKKNSSDRAVYSRRDKQMLEELKTRAIAFNDSSEFNHDYVANIDFIDDQDHPEGAIAISIEKRNATNSQRARQMKYNESLNTRLREILAEKGVSVGALTDLEERAGINGVTDFSQARYAAEGTVELIRIGHDERGQQALPEEFAHFAIETMVNNPLVQRLLNHISQNNLAQEILADDYDIYNIQYKGDSSLLSREAAGKLLARHLLQAADIPQSSYKNLLQRVINAVKTFFRSFRISDIHDAMRQADNSFHQLALDILNGSSNLNMEVANIRTSDKLFSLQENIARDQVLTQKIIDSLIKKINIYEKRSFKKGHNFSNTQRALIDELEESLETHTEIQGIENYIEFAIKDLYDLETRIKEMNKESDTSLHSKGVLLRDIKNYVYGYGYVLGEIKASLVDETDETYDKIKSRVNDAFSLVEDMYTRYRNSAMPLWADFIRPFLGDIIIPYGEHKGEKLTVESLMEKADKDISFWDRWLDSMADSSDYMLRLFDQVVKMAKDEGRLNTIDYSKELQAAAIKLEQAGIRDTAWMFERDAKGNLTGNYISKINRALYNQREQEMYDTLRQKYGDNPIGSDSVDYFREKDAWYAENADRTEEGYVPKESVYGNKDFNKLNKAQKEYYDTILAIKAAHDAMLPDYATTLYNAVKIRKDLIERVKDSEGIHSGAKQIWESVKDIFLRRSDDTEFGDKSTLKDFEGNEIQMLPIYYTKIRPGENMNDISTDVTSTMIAYVAMAQDYNEMNKIIDLLEIGRDLMKERQVVQNKAGNPLKERLFAVGRKVESSLTKKGAESRIQARLDDFFNMQVYNRYMSDEGTFGKTAIDVGKTANFVNVMTALNTYAINLLSGISNVATGNVMMHIEALSKEFFTESDTRAADLIYAKAMPAFMDEIGKRVKTSKLALWNEKFNVMQEYESEIKEKNFDRKSRFSQILKNNTLYILNNAGEHWMQTRTSLALAQRMRMKGPDGKEVNLWDAMEVVYKNPKNKALGATLELKKGYTKADGSEFTRDDIKKFTKKSKTINQHMHGIYNMLDRNAFQRHAIGRMVMMYRKYLKPSLNKRWGKMMYDFDLEAWREGYYMTTGRFISQLYKDLRQSRFDLAASWKELTPTEKANVRRTMADVGIFLGVSLAMTILTQFKDKKRPWLARMLAYQAARLYTEIGSLTPGPQIIKEALTLIKSPAAGINTISDQLGLINLLYPGNYGEGALLKSGRYKGHWKAYKYLMNVIPGNRTIYRALTPEEAIQFYLN